LKTQKGKLVEYRIDDNLEEVQVKEHYLAASNLAIEGEMAENDQIQIPLIEAVNLMEEEFEVRITLKVGEFLSQGKIYLDYGKKTELTATDIVKDESGWLTFILPSVKVDSELQTFTLVLESATSGEIQVLVGFFSVVPQRLTLKNINKD